MECIHGCTNEGGREIIAPAPPYSSKNDPDVGEGGKGGPEEGDEGGRCPRHPPPPASPTAKKTIEGGDGGKRGVVEINYNTITLFLPVHKARKFSAVFGTTSPRISMTMRPAGLPPMVMSK